MPERLAAFDTSSLLAVQANASPYKEAHRLLRASGFLFAIVPAVLQRLEAIRRRSGTVYTTDKAQGILADPSRLGLLTNLVDKLRDTEHDVVDIHVSRIIERGVLHEDQRTILTAIMEAAYLDCVLFVTNDQAVLNDRRALTAALVRECGMRSIAMFSAEEIVQFFSETRT